jgi:multidrug efflux pump subunit AcrA (membrane-fusion protein)
MTLNDKPKPKKPVINILLRIGICALVLVFGFFGMSRLAGMKKPPAEVTQSERPLKVRVVKAVPEDVAVNISGYGEVRALNTVALSPEVAGRIVAIHPRLEIGEQVTKEEMLFQIDPANYRTAVLEAESAVAQSEVTIARLVKQQEIDTARLKTIQRNRDLAEIEFKRVQRLYQKDKVGTRSGVERAEQAYNAAVDQADQLDQAVSLYPLRIKEAKSALAAARARLSLARTNLARCTVKAPFGGRIKQVGVEKDQYVHPGAVAVTLADDSELEIQVPIDSRDARRWLQFSTTSEAATNAAGSAWFDNLEPAVCAIHWTEQSDDTPWRGRLDRVVEFDPQTRTITVAVRIDAQAAVPPVPGGLPLVEGMFCRVDIPGHTLTRAVRLPRWAVSYEGTVYVVQDGRLHTARVQVNHTEGDFSFVTGGIATGQIVITTRLIAPLENSLVTYLDEPVASNDLLAAAK